MMPALLDLNDCNLQLWHAEQHVQSPGYALFDNPDYLFGNKARASARLRPREINTRYWWQLGTEPLSPGLGPARHTGDLAHAHLKALHLQAGEPAEVIIAVSDTMQQKQMSLLLGIVQQCPFSAVGLISRSTALASLYQHNGTVMHLELQLHQAALTEIDCAQGECELQGTVVLPGCGLLTLQEQLVELIATAFVRQARFDPRRRAESEQQLYDALPQLLKSLQQERETSINIGGHGVRIDRQALAPVSQHLLDHVRQSAAVSGENSLLLLDPITALLPGIDGGTQNSTCLQSSDVHTALYPGAAELVQGGAALSYLTRLRSSRLRESGSGLPITTTAYPRCEHQVTCYLAIGAVSLVVPGTALTEGWEIKQLDGRWHLRGSGTPPIVNGQQYSEEVPLGTGDTIEIGPDFLARLIEVDP